MVHKYWYEYFIANRSKWENYMLTDREWKLAYLSCIRRLCGLLVNTVKLNWAKKFDIELCSILSLTTYMHFKNCTTSNRWQGYHQLWISYLLPDRLSRNELWFNGNEQCYIGALTQVLHRIIPSLNAQVLLFAVAKEYRRNIHLECTINLQHTQRSSSTYILTTLSNKQTWNVSHKTKKWNF